MSLVTFSLNDSIDSAKQNFIENTHRIHDSILQRINASDEIINSLSALFNTITYVDADQFRLFAEDSLSRHPYVQSVAYMPLISANYRKEFEEEMHENGYVTFSIKEQVNNRYTVAENRSIYFPSLFLEPLNATTARQLGFDVLSDSQFEDAILYAIDSADAVASIANLAENRDGNYIIFKALYTGKAIPNKIIERRQMVNGLISIHMDMNSIVNELDNPGKLDIAVELIPGTISNNSSMYRLVNQRASEQSNTSSYINETFNKTLEIHLKGYDLTLKTNKTFNWQDMNHSSIASSFIIGITLTLLLMLIARRTQGAATEKLLRYSELRLRKWNSAITKLAKSKLLSNENLLPSIQEILKTAADNMNVSRTSVWLYSDDKSSMQCIDLYEAALDQHSEGLILNATDYPTYFTALEEGRVINAADAFMHPEINDIKNNYLIPNDIKSLLNSPIRIEGEMVGILCFENTKIMRNWAPDEQNFSASMADMVAMAIQVSKRKKIEHELREAHDKALVAEQTMSNFLANMSHEIRTPLTAIIGFSESLLDRKITKSDRLDATNTIIRSGKHLLRIINDILDISKIEANKLSIENLQVSPFELLSDVEALARLQAESKGIAFELQFEYPLPSQIITDPVRLKQILINLCNNSIKFTDNGKVIVHTSCDSELQQMKFEVIDSGIGLTLEQKGKLFQPFSQADNSTTRKYGGTGLGLYLTKQLSEMLGGTITVESEYGKGSNFTTTISTGVLAADNFVNEKPKPVSLENLPAPPEISVSGHILLAEDNIDNQKLVSIYLKKMGATVTIAENGQQAMDLALSKHYDLVLMDMQMPVLDGLKATEILCKKGYTTPIIALTANTQKEDKDKCYKAGCSDFLNKPIIQKQFNSIIQKYLKPGEELATSLEPIKSTLLNQQPDLEELVARFTCELPNSLSNLRQAYDEKDWESLNAQVHSLKGTGGNFGYPEITELTNKIESEAALHNSIEIEKLLDELDIVAERMAMSFSKKTA